MTVICWDGTTLAADKRASSGGFTYTFTKIAVCGSFLVGVSGRGDRVREFWQWVRDGLDPKAFPERGKDDDASFTAMVISRDGTIARYEGSPMPIIVEDRKHAIGTGREYAMAAMFLDAGAERACEVACQFDENCGNGIDTLTFDAVPVRISVEVTGISVEVTEAERALDRLRQIEHGFASKHATLLREVL